MSAVIEITLYELAERYIGVRELEGTQDHPLIQWWLSRCFDGSLGQHDEVPWCSAFLVALAWELGLVHPGSAMARSWLKVGQAVDLIHARVGFDVVVLWRVAKDSAFGHVGLFSGFEGHSVHLLGGNQDNSVKVSAFPIDRILGVRRLLSD